MEKNLSTGSVPQALVEFSLPFLLSYSLQTLYGMAGLFIIGWFYSVDSTTVVSIGSQVMHMLAVMIVGLAKGATVLIRCAASTQKPGQATQAIGSTVTLFILLSALALAGLLLAARPIAVIMRKKTSISLRPRTIRSLLKRGA